MKNDDVKYRMKEINGVIVGKSNGKGEGLFAARPFEAGEIILSYDNWNQEIFDKQPDFIKEKIKSSQEYQRMINGEDGKPINETKDVPF